MDRNADDIFLLVSEFDFINADFANTFQVEVHCHLPPEVPPRTQVYRYSLQKLTQMAERNSVCFCLNLLLCLFDFFEFLDGEASLQARFPVRVESC